MPTPAEPIAAAPGADARWAVPGMGLWPEPTESFWTSLRFLAISRLVLVVLLLLFVLLDKTGQAVGEGFDRKAFIAVGLVYLAAALVFASLVNRLRPWFHSQLVVHVFSDLLALAALMHAAGGGRSGVGVLMIGAVAGAAVDDRAAGGLHGDGIKFILVDAGDGLGPDGIGGGNLKLET